VKNVALLLTSVVLSILVVDVGLRSVGFTSRVLSPNRFFTDGAETTWSIPNTELGWINREGVSISIESGDAPMTFWSNGRRASRADPTLLNDRTPVMVSGGSNAQSYGVRDEESFPYLLAEQFPNLWIENFGNGGFSTVQTFLLTEKMLQNFYKGQPPRLIILTFADSHIVRNVSDQSWLYSISDSEGRYVSPPHFRLADGELVFYPFQTIGLWPLETHSALITTFHNIWLQSFAFNTADQGVEVSRRVFSRFAQFAQRKGSDLLVVILEDYQNVSGDVFSNAVFPVLDCSGFERTAPDDYLMGGGSHPNARYHAHFARCIGQWLDDYLQTAPVQESP
jgi:hypothetical protein